MCPAFTGRLVAYGMGKQKKERREEKRRDKKRLDERGGEGPMEKKMKAEMLMTIEQTLSVILSRDWNRHAHDLSFYQCILQCHHCLELLLLCHKYEV